MHALLKLALLLLATGVLAGCPGPAPQALAGLARVGGSFSIPGRAHDYTIRGRVETTRFRVQESFGDIAPEALVGLIDGTTGATLQTARTNSSGAFEMVFPQDFVPDFRKFYTLEAVKGGKINGAFNSAGAPAIRLRTVLQWNLEGEYWKSLTGVNQNDPVVINRSTTALSVAVGLRQAAVVDPANRAIFYNGVIGQIDLKTADGDYPHKYTQNTTSSTITEPEFRTLFDLVKQALDNAQDPVGSIAWANQPTTNPRQYVLLPPTFMLGTFDVASGRASDSIKASGAGFPLNAGAIKVVFSGGAEAGRLTVNPAGTQLVFEVPVGALSGPVTIKVMLPGSSSELIVMGPSFTILTTDGHDVVDASGSLWVAGRGNNTLWTLSSTGVWTKRTGVAIGWDGPRSLALNPQGQVTFTSWNSGTVNRLQPGTGAIGTVTTHSTGFNKPWGIARDPAGGYLVANSGTDEIRRVAENGGGSSSGVATISAPTGPVGVAGLAFGPYGDVFVAGFNTGTLYMLASTSLSVPVPVLTGLAKPAGVAVQLDGTVAIACYGSDQIVRWHPQKGLLPPIAPRGTHLGILDVAADDQGRLVFGAFDSHTLGRVEQNGAITDLALAPRNVWGLSSNASGDLAIGIINDLWPYGSRPRDSRVYIAPFANGSYQPFQAIDGFGNPEAVAWDATGDLYVADADASTLSRIDRKTGQRQLLIQNVGRVSNLAIDAAGKIFIGALDGALRTWTPGQSGLARFAPSRSFWAVASDPGFGNGAAYLGSPADGRIVEVAADGTSRSVAEVPGVGGLVISGGTLYALSRDTGAISTVNTSTGAVLEVANVGPGALDFTTINGDFWASMRNGAFKKTTGLLGQGTTAFQLTGGDQAVRLFPRSTNGGEIYFTSRLATSVQKLGNLAGAPATTSVAAFSPMSGGALISEPATESQSGLTGLAFFLSDLYVAQSVSGASRIYKLTGSFAADQTTATPWLTLDAPVLGMTSFNQGGTGILVTANPQEGTVATPGTLDDSQGFSINTGTKAVTALGMAVGRTMGVALVPPGFVNFYLLASPALNSTAIAFGTSGGTWRRVAGQAPCCGANHPFVDGSGNLYVPSYTGFLGVKSYGVGGTPGSDFTGSTFGAMSGVAADARGSGLIGGSLGGGVANAPLVRFSAGQAAVALDNWPFEPGF